MPYVPPDNSVGAGGGGGGATTGGASVFFRDVTEEAGVSYLQHAMTEPKDCLFVGKCEPDRISGGAAAGDYDGDGWVDLFVTRLDDHDLLFRNLGDGTFAEVSEVVGLTAVHRTNGAAWIDVENDGDLDLYVTTVEVNGHYLLYINNGGSFVERAQSRGVALMTGETHVGQSIAVGDYDADGWLDMFVTEWRPSSIDATDAPNHTRLLRNRGVAAPGYFEDATGAAGVTIDLLPTQSWYGDGAFAFAPAFVDLDGDDLLDLAVVGDFKTSRLFWNQGDGTFIDGTGQSGTGKDTTGMGSSFGDIDGDGEWDWFVSAIAGNGALGKGNVLYRGLGARKFEEATETFGVADGGWGWGTALFDYDNDGDLDLALTNGVDFPFTGGGYEDDPMHLWRNDGEPPMVEVATETGLLDTRPGKGLLVFDYDRDGDLDVFVANNAAEPSLYRNEGASGGWLRVRVLTAEGRDAIGAKVWLTTSTTQMRQIGVGSHFLGQSENVAHFGLGDQTVSEVKVRWLDTGLERVLSNVAPNSTLVVAP